MICIKTEYSLDIQHFQGSEDINYGILSCYIEQFSKWLPKFRGNMKQPSVLIQISNEGSLKLLYTEH
jgi:hypothetical protein